MTFLFQNLTQVNSIDSYNFLSLSLLFLLSFSLTRQFNTLIKTFINRQKIKQFTNHLIHSRVIKSYQCMTIFSICVRTIQLCQYTVEQRQDMHHLKYKNIGPSLKLVEYQKLSKLQTIKQTNKNKSVAQEDLARKQLQYQKPTTPNKKPLSKVQFL